MSAPAGVLLAAQAQAGLPVPIPLLEWGGAPLVTKLLGRLQRTVLAPIVVVLGVEAERVLAAAELEGADVLIDYDWEEGPGSSVRVGFDYLARRRLPGPAFLFSVEHPNVDLELLEPLLAAHEGAVTVPVYRYSQGYPILVDRSRWESFMTREAPPLDVVAAHPDWVTELHLDSLSPRRLMVDSDVAPARARFGAA